MISHHTLVPDDGHSLLSTVCSLRDEGEIILAHGPLGSAEGAVSTASHLQITAAQKTHTKHLQTVLLLHIQ